MTKLLILWAEALSVLLGGQHLLYDLRMFHNSPELLPLPFYCTGLLQEFIDYNVIYVYTNVIAL